MPIRFRRFGQAKAGVLATKSACIGALSAKRYSSPMAPLDALLGLFGLVLATAVLSLVGWGVHFVTRPKAMPTVRDTDALKIFEPRGGRQRFSVRLFEAGALASVWVLASGVLTLFLYADGLSARARLFASVFGGALLVGTWWTWRRGAFRGPPAVARTAASRPRRPRRG